MSKTLTIFTPTFNRGYIIETLYRSLLKQTNHDFCWMVVDDGSTDNTKELIDRFKEEKLLDIIYIYQDNRGKQLAHNTGVEACTTELFFCVDSDDWITPTAVEDILNLWEKRRNEPNLSGIIAMRGRDESHPIKTWFPKDLNTTTMWDLYYKYHHKGDTALVYRTDVLRKYPFVVAPGEKFIGETYVYHKIDQDYDLAVLPKIVWITEYLSDGYTKNVRKVTRENPKSYMLLKRDYIDYADTFLVKFQSTALYLVGAYFADCFWSAYKELPNKVMATFAIPLAYLLAITEFRDRSHSSKK